MRNVPLGVSYSLVLRTELLAAPPPGQRRSRQTPCGAGERAERTQGKDVQSAYSVRGASVLVAVGLEPTTLVLYITEHPF